MNLSSATAMHRPPHAWLLAAAALAALLAGAARAADDGERGRIAQERSELEARYAARERACRERFVVSSCVEDAKRERRQGLDALRARQLKVDEERRRERTSARRAELAAKAAEDARREQERAARAASAPSTSRGLAPRSLERRREGAGDAPEGAASAASGVRTGHDRPAAAGNPLGIKPSRRDTVAERQEREARNRASYETRQRQAAEHRERVTEATRKRLQEHPAVAPLPAGSAPR